MPRIYTRRPIRDRLLSRAIVDLEGEPVIDGSPCWNWSGHINPGGYGEIGKPGHSNGHLLSHRVAYELYFGPIPSGLDIDHLCRNRACCNPAHLEAVTRSVNLRRGLHGGGDFKPGHETSEAVREKLRLAAGRQQRIAGRFAGNVVPWSATRIWEA